MLDISSKPTSLHTCPTGTIKPTGWALDQANTNFSYSVNGSIWVKDGSIEYSLMHESAPYWLSASPWQVKDFLDWTLDHQGSDGWIGPEPFVANATIPRLVWPRYLVLLGLIFDYQYVRWEELIYALQWVYDTDPRGMESELLETMHLVRNQGYSWKDNWFTDAIFPKQAVLLLSSPCKRTHGVNTAEALKSEALAWRFTGDPADIQSTFDRIDMVYTYHGRASGTFSADEHIAGLDPSRGTELCAVVEQIFSLATIYSILGNNSVADRVERLAYNALPAGIMHDWWSNQIWAQDMDPSPWVNNGPNSNVFGFEPNYPCCTVNHPQAYPKFWSHSFMTNETASSLIHTFLGPATFTGTVGKSNNLMLICLVIVSVDTLYPFGLTFKYTVTASRSFTFQIRIPEWAKNNQSTIAVNRAKATLVTPDASSLHSVKVTSGSTTIEMTLHAPLETELRTNNAVAVTRGPLNYAVELSYNTTSAPSLRSVVVISSCVPYFTPTDNHTLDNTLLPTTEWRLAIDPSTIEVNDSSTKISSMPYYAWAPGAQPVSMTATACQIEWGLVSGTASAPPLSPNECMGETFKVKLVPFAGAKLRLGEIPTMKST
ncbi:hypothetical protein CPB84DRAFT_1815219 [Gymnopilus junonius]|uniref:Uncharacterized protein n=1 Tax=Gymnopilus junonius TaxID=109634 RepID=A0A9P5NQ58_GYMJU|nr:hypothetical protein CPB84DRAFT_1815219 [Gymnopilus junonius]